MNFQSNRYVPVLKIKQAEKAALAVLGSSFPHGFTPLLEVVEMKSGVPLQDHLDRTFKNLATSLVQVGPCFLDTRELATDAAALAVYHRATAEGIPFVPVVGLNRKVGNGPGLEHTQNGVALRLTREELQAGGLGARISQFLTQAKLSHANVDLIVDMGDVGEMITVGVATLASQFLQAVPAISAWRTLTISGCAFPKSMGAVGRNSFKLVDRTEWTCWRYHLYPNRAKLARLPAFSDCAIQHSAGVEGFDPVTMAASASARVTTGDQWLLIKGQSTKKVRPSTQYPKIAGAIVSNLYGQHYAGKGHCDGCAKIFDAAQGAPRLGSLEAWRRLGTIHHVTTVLRDQASLNWP